MNKLFLAVPIFLALLACDGGKKTAGGSPGETTNGFQAAVVDKNGVPATSARVYMYNPYTLEKLDSCQTDSAGNFAFVEESPSNFGLELVSPDSGQMAWYSNVSSLSSSGFYGLKQASLLYFITDSLDARDTLLQLVGTPYKFGRNASERYTLRVPNGSYALNVNNKFAGYINARPSSTPISITPKVISGVLFENFDDGDTKVLFGSYWPSGTGNWWLGQNDEITCINPVNTDELPNAILDSSAWSGKSIRIQYQIIQWIGLRFGNAMDLRRLDSISFMAKGQGKIRLSLEHIRTFADPPPDSSLVDKIFMKSVWSKDLTPNWKRYTVRPSDSVYAPLANSKWADISKNIDIMSFFFQEGFEAWLDEITVYGIPTEAWAGTD